MLQDIVEAVLEPRERVAGSDDDRAGFHFAFTPPDSFGYGLSFSLKSFPWDSDKNTYAPKPPGTSTPLEDPRGPTP
jgi:hypothetical protein